MDNKDNPETLIEFAFSKMKEYEIEKFEGFGMTINRNSLELHRDEKELKMIARNSVPRTARG